MSNKCNLCIIQVTLSYAFKNYNDEFTKYKCNRTEKLGFYNKWS